MCAPPLLQVPVGGPVLGAALATGSLTLLLPCRRSAPSAGRSSPPRSSSTCGTTASPAEGRGTGESASGEKPRQLSRSLLLAQESPNSDFLSCHVRNYTSSKGTEAGPACRVAGLRSLCRVWAGTSPLRRPEPAVQVASSRWGRARQGVRSPAPTPTVHLGHFFRSWIVGQGCFHPVPKPHSGTLVPEVGPAVHVMRRGVCIGRTADGWGLAQRGSCGNSRQRGLPTGQSSSPADLETLPSSAGAGRLVARARPLTGAERPQESGVHLQHLARAFSYTVRFVCRSGGRKSASRPRSACPGLGVHSQPAREVLHLLHA